MMTISNNDIARAIYLASKDCKEGEEQKSFSSKVVQFLHRKHLLSRSPDIIINLEKIINEHNKVVVAKISSATKISEKINKELSQALAIRYSAKEIILDEKIDEKLLGGFKLEINDEVIDFTAKNKIRKLQAYLTENA